MEVISFRINDRCALLRDDLNRKYEVFLNEDYAVARVILDPLSESPEPKEEIEIPIPAAQRLELQRDMTQIGRLMSARARVLQDWRKLQAQKKQD